MAKDSESLLGNPMSLDADSKKAVEAPVTTVINHLVTTEGKKLHILTRANQELALAVQIGHIYESKFGSRYIAGRIERIEQMAISMDGKGREDLPAALQAGGKLPDAYFEGSKTKDYGGI